MRLTGRFALTLVLLALALSATIVHADRGVGVTLGAIDVDERLVRGGAYSLPLLGVINTGSEPGQYELAVTYLEDQKQLRPPEAWFDFQPQRFYLEADEVRNVSVRLQLPSSAGPGDYFAYLEAHRVDNEQGVAVGAAAATKLSFSIKPTGWFETLRVRFNRLLDENEPWSYLLPLLALSGLAFWALSRRLRVQLRIERRR